MAQRWTGWSTSATSNTRRGEFRQHLVHHVRVDESEARMAERTGNGADDLKTQALPEAHRAVIGRHHQVELHRSVTTTPGFSLRMFTHRRRDAPAARVTGDHVAAVADVCRRAVEVRSQIVSAKQPATVIVNSHEDDSRIARPDRSRIVSPNVRWDGVGVSRSKHRLEHRPDGRPIGCLVRSDHLRHSVRIGDGAH
jgi:hypothetical protein